MHFVSNLYSWSELKRHRTKIISEEEEEVQLIRNSMMVELIKCLRKVWD